MAGRSNENKSISTYLTEFGNRIHKRGFIDVAVKDLLHTQQTDIRSFILTVASRGLVAPLEELLKYLAQNLPQNKFYVVFSNSRGPEHRTLLHEVASLDNHKVACTLLRNYPDKERYALLSVQDKQGKTPIHSAAEGGNSEFLQTIVQSIGTPAKVFHILNKPDHEDQTWLHLAAVNSHTSVIKDVLAALSPQDQLKALRLKNKRGRTAINYVTEKANLQTTRTLVQSVHSENRPAILQSTIASAASQGQVELVKSLFKRLNDTERSSLLTLGDENKKTVIHHSAFNKNSSETLSWILDQSAGQRFELLQTGDAEGRTVLQQTAKYGYIHHISPILSNLSAEQELKLLGAKDHHGKTAEEIAVDGRHQQVADMLGKRQQAHLNTGAQLLKMVEKVARLEGNIQSSTEATEHRLHIMDAMMKSTQLNIKSRVDEMDKSIQSLNNLYKVKAEVAELREANKGHIRTKKEIISRIDDLKQGEQKLQDNIQGIEKIQKEEQHKVETMGNTLSTTQKALRSVNEHLVELTTVQDNWAPAHIEGEMGHQAKSTRNIHLSVIDDGDDDEIGPTVEEVATSIGYHISLTKDVDGLLVIIEQLEEKKRQAHRELQVFKQKLQQIEQKCQEKNVELEKYTANISLLMKRIEELEDKIAANHEKIFKLRSEQEKHSAPLGISHVTEKEQLQKVIPEYVKNHGLMEVPEEQLLEITYSLSPETICDIIASTKDDDGRTALHLAADANHAAMIDSLLAKFSDEQVGAALVDNSLELIEISNEQEQVGTLLSMQDKSGRTVFHCLASNNSHQLTDKLLKLLMEYQRFEALRLKDSAGNTAISLAVLKNHSKVVFALFSNLVAEQNYELLTLTDELLSRWISNSGTDTNPDMDIINHIAGRISPDQWVELMSKADSSSYTPLHWVAVTGLTDVTKAMLKHTPKDALVDLLTRSDSEECTPILSAELSGYNSVTNIMLECLTSAQLLKLLKYQDGQGQTIVHRLAGSNKSTNTLKLMMDGVEEKDIYDVLQLPDGRRNTAVHIAATRRSTEVFKLVVLYLNNQPDSAFEVLRKPDVNGRTVLHVLARSGSVELIKHMLSTLRGDHRQQLLTLRDGDGGNRRTAEEIAKVNGNEGVTALLKKLRNPKCIVQ